MKVICRLFIICILSAVLSWSNYARADVEYIYPDSSDTTQSDWLANTGTKHGAIDDTQGSPDDATTYIYATAGNQDEDGGFGNLVTADSDDTYTAVVMYLRGQEPGGERITWGYNGGSTETLDAATWTNDSKDLYAAGVDTYAEINALTWYIIAKVVGKDTHTRWDVTQVYIAVTYTPVTPGAGKVIIID